MQVTCLTFVRWSRNTLVHADKPAGNPVAAGVRGPCQERLVHTRFNPKSASVAAGVLLFPNFYNLYHGAKVPIHFPTRIARSGNQSMSAPLFPVGDRKNT